METSFFIHRYSRFNTNETTSSSKMIKNPDHLSFTYNIEINMIMLILKVFRKEDRFKLIALPYTIRTSNVPPINKQPTALVYKYILRVKTSDNFKIQSKIYLN